MSAALTWLWLLVRLALIWTALSFATTAVYVALRRLGFFRFEVRR